MNDWKGLAEQAWNAPSWREAAQQHYRDRSKNGSEGADIVRARRLLADNVSLDCAYRELNDTRNRPTPQTVVEAIMFCVRERGPKALHEPANIARLRDCDAAALAEIDARMTRLKEGRQ